MTHCIRWLLHLSCLLWAFVLVIPPAQAQQVCPTGYPRTTPDSDFTSAGNGMVQHTPTGLIWKRCAEGQSWDGTTCVGTAATYTWQAAFQRVDDVNAATAGTENLGQTDWRLPNINELKSLVEEGCLNPAINLTQFPNILASAFWSASPSASSAATAWVVSFNLGVSLDNWYDRSNALHVRLVRAGQSFLNFDAAAGTVTVSKAAIAGTAAGSVLAGTNFSITLTCGTTTLGPINATTTAPAVFINVPPGSCTVAEDTLPTIAGVSWGAPSYDPTNSITVTGGANTAVTVTNTANITTYTVTATAGTHGSISPASQTVNHDATTSFTVNPDTGYTAAVSGCGGSLSGTTYTTGTITGACAVTASFTPNNYAITATASPAAGGTVSCTPNPVNHGSDSACTATPATGYTFSGFSGDCTGASCALSSVTGTRNVTALFTRNNYAITAAVNPMGSGVISCAPNPVDYGGTSNCTATANTGYTFTSFSGDCTGTSCTLTNITANKSVTASFSQNSYAVTATAGANGTISPASQTVNHGGTTSFTVTPNAGYTAAVSGCGGSLSGTTYTTGTITGACVVTASFSLAPPNTQPITLTQPTTGGTISCTPNPVPQGGSATCAATPSPGYTFSGWSGDCTGTGVCTLSNVTGAKAISASFSAAAPKTYTGSTATGTGNATATVTGGGDTCGFSDAQFVPLSSVAAVPPAAYSFPHGLFKFTLSQCTVGSTITLSIRYPTALPETTRYWKYGPTADQAAHWYPLSQAAINGATVTFNLTDGGLGDNDLKADGTISDPSGPGVPVADIPTLSEWAMLILVSLLLGIGVWQARRREMF